MSDYDWRKNYRTQEEMQELVKLCPEGSWVRYRVTPLMKTEPITGVGRVKFWWWYDSPICEIEDFTRKPNPRVAVFARQRKDEIEPVGIPTAILEGVGL